MVDGRGEYSTRKRSKFVVAVKMRVGLMLQNRFRFALVLYEKMPRATCVSLMRIARVA